MKKWFFLCSMIFLIMLSSCQDSDQTYSYQLTKDNYLTFFDVEHEHSTEGEAKKITTMFTLKNEKDHADNVRFEMSIHLYHVLFNEYTPIEKAYEITFDEQKSQTHEMTYLSYQTFEQIEFKDISGIIRTNKKQDLPTIPTPEESVKNYQKLVDDMSAIGDQTKFTVMSYITVKQRNQMYSIAVKMVVDVEDFYLETIIDRNTGYIVEKKNDVYMMYELFYYQQHDYMRLFDVFDEKLEDWEDVQGMGDFDPSWQYAYHDGVYTIQADIESILRFSLEDEDMINDLLKSFTSRDVFMTIELKEEEIKLRTSMTIDEVELTIHSTYKLGVLEKTDTSGYIKLPAQSPCMIEEVTDLSVRQQNHVLFSGYANYYRVNLETGTYAIELDDLYEIKLYDKNMNEVMLVKDPAYDFQDYYQNIYQIEAGEYIVEIDSNQGSIASYDLQFIKLDSLYETIADIDNPVIFTEGVFNLEIEGSYDIVLATFDAPEGGMLVLKPQDTFSKYTMVIRPDGGLSYYDVVYLGDDMYIHLMAGKTTLLFRNPEGREEASFVVEHYGNSPYMNEPIPEVYPRDFVVTTNHLGVRYHFTLTEERSVTFQQIIDPFTPQVTFGIDYQLWVVIDGFEFMYQSFYIINNFQINLPPGHYFLRSLGTVSFKLRAQIEMPEQKEDVDAFVLRDVEIDKVVASPRSFMSVYNQYVGQSLNIHFSTGGNEKVMILFESGVSYVLYDDSGHIYNPNPQLGFGIFELPQGSYRIYVEANDFSDTVKHALAVIYIKD